MLFFSICTIFMKRVKRSFFDWSHNDCNLGSFFRHINMLQMVYFTAIPVDISAPGMKPTPYFSTHL